MDPHPRTVWHVTHPKLTATELFELEQHEWGFSLRGRVVGVVEGVPLAASYEVMTDPGWRTRRVEVTLLSDASRTLTIDHDGEGGWSVDGVSDPALHACRDVDLGISPSTNTLPIRRLGLRIGEVAGVDAAWVRFPALTVEVLSQTYERLGERSYRYRSADFQRDLEIDEDGVVVRYGDDLWQAVTAARASAPRRPT